jgi:diguanylate cyclase (GGDEF)-like protein/PAS domain S-box-containing protein
MRWQSITARRAAEMHLETLLGHSSDLVAVYDHESGLSYVSPATWRLLGWRPEECIARQIVEFVHPADLSLLASLPGPGEPSASLVVRVRHKDKDYRTFEAVVTDLASDPAVRGLLINARDITERINAEQELERTRSNEQFVRAISTGFATSTVEATDALLNEAVSDLREFIGATRAAILATNWRDSSMDERFGAAAVGAPVLPERATPLYLSQLVTAAPGMEFGEVIEEYGTAPERRLTEAVEIDADEPIAGLVCVPLLASEKILGFLILTTTSLSWRCPDDAVGLLRTVGEICAGALARQRAGELLTDQSLHDPLTGMPNRRLFVERLDQALVRCQRSNDSVGLLFIDGDDFKDVNDTLGHDEGDELLVALGRRLQSLCLSGETVARFGGDEYVVLIEAPDAGAVIAELGERILGAVREPYEFAGRTVRITVSVGATVHDGVAGPMDASTMLRRADTAMYRAKSAGRNRVVMFTPEMEERARERFELVAELRQVTRAPEQFKVWFQPIYRITDLELSGFEALVRWQHPTRGLLQPSSFIDLAEESGEIKRIGLHVLEQSLSDLAQLEKFASISANTATIAVNLSVRQLAARSGIADIRSILRAAGTAPHRVTFEVTESIFANREQVLPPLIELRDLGVKIAIDDFGTGYSSLAYLRDLPVDLLKIDRSFVNRIGSNERDEAVLGTLVSLAEQLTLGTVAEGVETPEQLAALTRLGCTHAQGYLLARPAPLGQIVESGLSRSLAQIS